MDTHWTGNIEKLTIKNNFYRKVLFTTPTMQLVLMNLRPKQEIGMEKHDTVSQFIRVDSGSGLALVKSSNSSLIYTYELTDGSAILISPGIYHNIINTDSTKPMKLYTIYSPPQHREGTETL